MRLERVSPLPSPRLESSPGSTSISTSGASASGASASGASASGASASGASASEASGTWWKKNGQLDIGVVL